MASVLVGGCAKDGAAREGAVVPVAATATAGGLPDVMATIGDESVTLADVRTRVGEQLDQLDAQYIRARDKLVAGALDTLVLERIVLAESKKTGQAPDQLVAAAAKGGLEPSDVDITSWYNENQARTGGRPIEQVRTQIADLLRKERRREAEVALAERLRQERGVRFLFEPRRPTFANEGAPTMGAKDAPVTLVEFSDFQCPFCQSTAPVLKQVAQAFGDSVHIVYRQYPITSLHPYAFKAAEASLCAHEQGKFWELHDAMFADQKKLAVSDLKSQARRLGMDGKKFDSCLDTGRYVEQVQNDQREGGRIGVTGTPAMFINGVYVEGGAVSYATIESLIRKELARVKARS